MNTASKIPPTPKLIKMFSWVHDNLGYQIAWRRKLPNSGDDTNEDGVLEDVESVDEKRVLDTYRSRLVEDD